MRGRESLVFVVVFGMTFLFAAVPAEAQQGNTVSPVDQTPVARNITRLPASTLNQAPDQSNGWFSDEGCDNCIPPGSQAVAENFIVSTAGAGFDLEQIVLWGGFGFNNIPPAVDDIDVLVHTDAAGVPGAVVCTETGIVPTSRTQTGVVIFGVNEYQVTIDLTTPCTLSDGTYWIEIFNNTGLGTDDWFWETGNLDAVNGVAGIALSPTTPGSGWTFFGDDNVAAQLNGTVVPVELQSFSVE